MEYKSRTKGYYNKSTDTQSFAAMTSERKHNKTRTSSDPVYNADA